jgi:lipopolysaccharide/colanic/teichoic acid biosynthesis glycosyltransferase
LTAEVVVLTRNSMAELARSLPAIREAAAVADAALLFVDFGSTDGTQDLLAAMAPGARAAWLTAEDGPIDALAVASACSDAEVLVVLSPTLEPSSSGAIRDLVEHLHRCPYAGTAAPALRSRNGELLRSTLPAPGPKDHWRVEWVHDGAFAVRREVLEGVTRSADSLPRSLDELRLCLQLRRRGLELHYLRSIELIDTGGRATERLRAQRDRSPSRAWRLLLRHPRYAVRLAGRRLFGRAAARAAARAFEIAFAGLLLALLSPLLVLIAIAVRLDSPGAVMFRQVRLGRRARPFRMYKFRTMRCDADSSLHADFVREMIRGRDISAGEDEGRIYKIHPDPRVTRVGRLLRRTSLDELPQLINVLRGDMTLVGFRPPIPYELDNYPDWYHRRFDGRPGITGLWQVSGRNERSYEEMVRLDIEYLNRRSLLSDAHVLARTVGAVLGGRGAY